MEGQMKVIAGIFAVAATLAGCATAPDWHAGWHSGWAKPGMTGEAFEKDVRDCDAQAMHVAAAQPGHRAQGAAGMRGSSPTAPIERSSEHEKAYRDCMASKGYTAKK
jgi:hypothetical protein